MGDEKQYKSRYQDFEGLCSYYDRLWKANANRMLQPRSQQTSQVSSTAPVLSQSNGRTRKFVKGNIEVFTTDDDYATTLVQAGYKEELIKRTGYAPIAASGFDPNDLQAWGNYQKPCCGGGTGGLGASYKDGKWHDTGCDSLTPPATTPDYYGQSSEPDYRPKPSTGGCECGSTKVGSDRHSSWCALYKR